MKVNIINKIFFTLAILICASGCDQTDIYVLCPAPIDINQGEKVVYLFTDSTGETSVHSVEMLDSPAVNPGDIVYTADGVSTDLNINTVCDESGKSVLSTEQSFLLLGGKLKLDSNSEAPSNLDLPPPVKFSLSSCVSTSVFIQSQQLSAEQCTYNTADNSETRIITLAVTEEGPSPMSKLLKYVWINNSNQTSVSAELTEWNGK